MKSPFKFLDSYTEQDHDIFFGRDRETEALYDALSGVKYLLVYGPSGAGKTSLIECGLRNQFSDADWYALTIRRGADLNRSVLAAIRESLDDDTELPDDTPFGEAIERLFSERFQPVYLLFDQFEELLISAEADEKKTFFTRLNELIQYKVPCRVLLIMREEFVGHLSEYEKECPSIFQHRFRLEKMGRADVRAVISKTLKAEQYRDAFSVAAPDALTDKILSKLPDNQRIIELAHVQVFLNELWERAHQAPNNTAVPQLRADLVKDKDSLQTVLDEFLKKQIDTLDLTYGEHNTLYTLAAMISERDTKLQVSQAEIEDALHQNEVTLRQALPQLLDTLAKHRIIRTLKSGGQTQYEISHDLLAKVVGDNRTEEMKMQDKARRLYELYEGRTALLAQPEINQLNIYKDVRKFPDALADLIKDSEIAIEKASQAEIDKARRRTRIFASVALVTLVAFGAAIFSFFDARTERNNAERQTRIAQDKTQNLEDVLDALYFYEDSLALAYNKRKYGFINKEGKALIDYKYSEAIPFDYRGYAKVRRRDVQYLIDAKGTEYAWTDDINKLSQSIEALDFKMKGGLKIDSIRQKIFNSKQLKILFLGGSKVEELPTEIRQLQQLQTLHVNIGKSLSLLPSEIGELRQLKNLNLVENNLLHLPPEIGKLESLEDLDLWGNRLSSLPTEIGQLKQLKNLTLASNFLSSVPPEIGELEQLQSLNLTSNMYITSLSSEIGKLKNLRTLDLSDNGLSSLPVEIGQLKNLQDLNLSYSVALLSLPIEIGQLQNLQTLDLTYAVKLSSLPSEIGQLSALKTLDLTGIRKLSSLPSEIGQLSNLENLNLSGVGLKSLPSEIGQLSNLQNLNLGRSQLNILPVEIGELKQLQNLNLGGNKLSDIPVEIGELKNLQKLDLSGNQLVNFPIGIEQLKKLQFLNLRQNKLDSLPSEIGQLRQLQELTLASNQLRTLPEGVRQLKKLQYLNLINNELSDQEKQKIKRLLPNCVIHFHHSLDTKRK